MIELIINVLNASWEILLESSVYILFGFFVAGLLKAFLPNDLVSKHLGKGKFSNILKASAIGVPIPLCSCGVVPAAAGIREQGASKGATASFMISTPETGVDSIAITYALLDPVMTVLRPLSAFITAVVTGVLVNVFDKDIKDNFFQAPEPSSCGGDCSCDAEEKKETAMEKFKNGMKFAFGELFEDIGMWFIVGVLIAGLITVFLSPELIENYIGRGFFSMIVMVLLATPLYVCATSSTPIVAALALKGLSPGAALVFLLAGPATNAASIAVVSKVIGKKATGIYLSAIILCSIGLGVLTNYLYGFTGIDITQWVQSGTHEEHGFFYIAASIVLMVLLFKAVVINRFSKKH